MKKMPAPMTEPALSGVMTNYSANHTPKLYQKPLSKFQTYENLINEFMAANPDHTDFELDRACLYFATKCGLTVAEKAKAKMGGSHVY
jgi:hypothetical protein